jgi:hypothetical protein
MASKLPAAIEVRIVFICSSTLAARAARLLEWDHDKMAIPNDAEANGWVNPPYRKG